MTSCKSATVGKGMCRGAKVVLSLMVCSPVASCDAQRQAEVPAPDYDAWERDAYPIVLRDCGFLACHGDADRFFVVYGPGRLRFDPETLFGAAATETEVYQSYQRARSMLVATEIDESPLLRKTLPGGGHRGVDRLGRSVYPSKDDPSYQVLRAWAAGELWYGEQ